MAAALRKITLNICRNYCTNTFFRRQGAILATKDFEFSQERQYTPPPPLAKYGGRHTVTLLPGDGIGPDLMKHVKEVFRVAGVPVDFEEILLDSHNESNDELEYAIISIKRNGVALKGNIETRINRPNFKSRNVVIRTDLDLFASMLWCKSVPGIETRHKDIDFILIRENTEGEYSSLEHESVNGVVESLKIITREKSMKIAKFAFDQAVKYNRKKVTAVHKANIMKLGDGLFLESCRQVSKDYPDIKFDSLIIDNCSMQMVSNPQQFDVLVMPNLYGNILSNIGCGLVGGPGLLSGRNIGDQFAVFETGSRNTGKSIAGKNIANPVAMFNAASDLLEYLGLDDHASLIRGAVLKTISVDKIHTPDIGGQASTTDIVDNIMKEIHLKSSIAAQQ